MRAILQRVHTYSVSTARLLAVFAGIGAVVISAPTAVSAVSKANAVEITIKDHVVAMSSPTAKAGLITFRLTNGDATLHEIDFVLTTLGPTALPVKTNGQFDEHAKGVKVVKEAVKVRAGATRLFTATLRPGSYVLVDNLPGHYKNGEAIALTVN